MPGTYRKRIYMFLVHTVSFRQTPICAHSTQRVKANRSSCTNRVDSATAAAATANESGEEDGDARQGVAEACGEQRLNRTMVKS